MRQLSWRKVLLIYVAMWAATTVAFEVCLEPEGPTETADSPLKQRLEWIPETPLIAVFGLANVLAPQTNNESMSEAALLVSAGIFIGLCVAWFCYRRTSAFPWLCGLQAVCSLASVAGMVAYSHLHGMA